MPTEYQLHVTESEVNLIGQALAELPFKISAAMITKLQQQVNEQQNEQQQLKEFTGDLKKVADAA